MKITIDRSKWRTGDDGPFATGTGRTLLKNKEGCRCCLGFICEQSYPDGRDVLSCYTPEQVGEFPLLTKFSPDEPGRVNTKLTNQAMRINDDGETTPAEKEAALLELFKDTIYELEFVGEYK